MGWLHRYVEGRLFWLFVACARSRGAQPLRQFTQQYFIKFRGSFKNIERQQLLLRNLYACVHHVTRLDSSMKRRAELLKSVAKGQNSYRSMDFSTAARGNGAKEILVAATAPPEGSS